MRAQRSFRPSLDGTLEDRVALTGMGAAALRNAEFTAPVNPTHQVSFNTPGPPRAGAAFLSVVRTTPVLQAGRTPSGLTGLNLSTTSTFSSAGAGTGLTTGTSLGSGFVPTTTGVTALSLPVNGGNIIIPLAANGSTLGASNLGLGANGTGLSFLTSGSSSLTTTGVMNLAGTMGFGPTGTFGFPANNNGAGFATIV